MAKNSSVIQYMNAISLAFVLAVVARLATGFAPSTKAFTREAALPFLRGEPLGINIFFIPVYENQSRSGVAMH